MSTKVSVSSVLNISNGRARDAFILDNVSLSVLMNFGNFSTALSWPQTQENGERLLSERQKKTQTFVLVKTSVQTWSNSEENPKRRPLFMRATMVRLRLGRAAIDAVIIQSCGSQKYGVRAVAFLHTSPQYR
jgi:hypothetical protein